MRLREWTSGRLRRSYADPAKVRGLEPTRNLTFLGGIRLEQ